MHANDNCASLPGIFFSAGSDLMPFRKSRTEPLPFCVVEDIVLVPRLEELQKLFGDRLEVFRQVRDRVVLTFPHGKDEHGKCERIRPAQIPSILRKHGIPCEHRLVSDPELYERLAREALRCSLRVPDDEPIAF